jgi:hypothetical protein
MIECAPVLASYLEAGFDAALPGAAPFQIPSDTRYDESRFHRDKKVGSTHRMSGSNV